MSAMHLVRILSSNLNGDFRVAAIQLNITNGLERPTAVIEIEFHT